MSDLRADWIAVDWGTSNLRAWAMAADGRILAQGASDNGMGKLTPGGFEAALLEIAGPWLGAARMDVFACGMVGARQGWVEAPYRAVPCAPLGAVPVVAPTSDPRLRVFVVPGLKQPQPADVIRGEETQIAGFLSLDPEFDGVLCLPGTHSKWARISAGEVVSFQTFMTGEMFSALAEATVLRHSLDAEGWNEDAFAQALSDAISRPEQLAARLFQLRAEALLNGRDGAECRAALSGYLIGAELAAARPYWLGQQVVLIGAPGLTARYTQALEAQGLMAQMLDADTMTLIGLAQMRANASVTA